MSPRTTASERAWVAFWEFIVILIPRVLERCYRTNNKQDLEDLRQQTALGYDKLSNRVEAHWDELICLSGSFVPADADEMIELSLSDIAFKQTLAAVRIRKWISNDVLSNGRSLFLRRVEDRSRADSEDCRDGRRRRKYVPNSTNIDRAMAEDADIVRGGSSQARSNSGPNNRSRNVSDDIERLTPLQLRILRAMREGLLDTEICEQHKISQQKLDNERRRAKAVLAGGLRPQEPDRGSG
jgi:DNA-binding CsgD family transcriptional regulator